MFSREGQSSCSPCATNVTSVAGSPLCNVYNASTVAWNAAAAVLAVGEWKCFQETSLLRPDNSSLLVYLSFSAVQEQQQVQVYVSCEVSAWPLLPESATLGYQLNASSSHGDTVVISTMLPVNPWVSANSCIACLYNGVGQGAVSVSVAMSRVQLVTQNEAVVIPALAPNNVQYLVLSTAANNSVSLGIASTATVIVTVTVVGGTVDVYLSLSTPTPALADNAVSARITSTSVSLSLALSGLPSVYVGLQNPGTSTTSLFRARGSPSDPRVTVTWSVVTSPGSSSSGKSLRQLSVGETAAVVILSAVAGIGCFIFLWHRLRPRRRNSVELRWDAVFSAQEVAMKEMVELSTLPPVPQAVPEELLLSLPEVESPQQSRERLHECRVREHSHGEDVASADELYVNDSAICEGVTIPNNNFPTAGLEEPTSALDLDVTIDAVCATGVEHQVIPASD